MKQHIDRTLLKGIATLVIVAIPTLTGCRNYHKKDPTKYVRTQSCSEYDGKEDICNIAILQDNTKCHFNTASANCSPAVAEVTRCDVTSPKETCDADQACTWDQAKGLCEDKE